MNVSRFAGAAHRARPNVQSVVLFSMETEAFKPLLHPCPIGLLFLSGELADARMLLGVALENAGAHEKGGSGDGVYKRLRIIDDEMPCLDTVSERERLPDARV